MAENIYNIEKKFPYKKSYYKDFSAVRSACLFVVKALTKLVEEMNNNVYFDFDSEGLLLRATDKDSLSKAKSRLEYWKDQTQIGILIDHIDKEDYKKFIDNELQGLWKKERAFINVISYDKFLAACEFLEKKGYKEPLKKYAQIYNDNKNFSLLMCTKHRFEEIKDRIYEILYPLQKNMQNPSQIHKQRSSAQKKSSETNSNANKKPITWDNSSSSSSSVSNNTDLNLNPFNQSLNSSYTKSNKEKENNNNSQQQAKTLDNLGAFQSEISLSNQTVSSYPDIQEISQSFTLKNAQNSQKSQKNSQNIHKIRSYEESDIVSVNSSEKGQNLVQQQQQQYSGECEKFQFQIKMIVWMIFSRILEEGVLRKVVVQQDVEDEESYLEIIIYRPQQSGSSSCSKKNKKQQQNLQQNQQQQDKQQQDLIQNDQEYYKLVRFFQETQDYVETLQMRVIYMQRPIEVYQKILGSTFFKILYAQNEQIIDLFHEERFKQTVVNLQNQTIQNKASAYLINKMDLKQNFCFLVTTRKKFAHIQDQITQYVKKINKLDIQDLYIDLYQPLFEEFPGKISTKEMQDIDKKCINQKKLGSYMENIDQQNNNNKLQEFYLQERYPCIVKLYNKQFFVKKYGNYTEYQILGLCQNLKLQNFYQSDFFVQQFGLKIQPIIPKNNIQKYQQSRIYNVYCFYDAKKSNLGGAIAKKLFKNPKVQLNLARQIIEALNFLHNNHLRPIAHGNLKPDNILLDEKQNVQLTDIVSYVTYSRFLPPEYIIQGGKSSEKKKSNQMKNFRYIQQQQLNLENIKPNLKSDIWTLGLVLYSIFMGEVVDCFMYLEGGCKSLEQIVYEQSGNSTNKKFLKFVLQLIDEILVVEPEERPDIKDIQEKIEKLSELF